MLNSMSYRLAKSSRQQPNIVVVYCSLGGIYSLSIRNLEDNVEVNLEVNVVYNLEYKRDY